MNTLSVGLDQETADELAMNEAFHSEETLTTAISAFAASPSRPGGAGTSNPSNQYGYRPSIPGGGAQDVGGTGGGGGGPYKPRPLPFKAKVPPSHFGKCLLCFGTSHRSRECRIYPNDFPDCSKRPCSTCNGFHSSPCINMQGNRQAAMQPIEFED